MRNSPFVFLFTFMLVFGQQSSQALVHAEYEDSEAMGVWEQAGFNPPTLWFRMELKEGSSLIIEERKGDSVAPGYRFEYSNNSTFGEEVLMTWDPNTAQASEEYKNSWSMTFEDNARCNHYQIESDKVAWEDVFWVAHEGTSWRTTYYSEAV